MVRILLVAAVLVAALGQTAAASEPDPQSTAKKPADPSGVYLCEGTNPDGHHYRGIVQIAALEDTFLVRWTLSDEIEVTGVGILRNDMLAVSYFGGTPAVVVYKVDAEKLVGEWTMGGADGKTFAETLTRVPEGSITIPQQQDRPHRRPLRSEPIKGATSI